MFYRLVLVLCALSPLSAIGGSITLPFNDYGLLSQNARPLSKTCAPPMGGMNSACGPVAAVNSLTYLQNMFPDIYKMSLIDQTAVKTAMDLSLPMYMNCAACNNGTSWNNFTTGLKGWIQQQLPGSTQYAMMQDPNVNFLFSQLMGKEDVELLLGFYNKTTGHRDGGHYVTLYGITDGSDDTLSFIDPSGGTGISSALNRADLSFTPTTGFIQINGYASGFNTRIDYAFAESPIPEPGTLASAFLAILLIFSAAFVQRRAAGYGLPDWRRSPPASNR